MYFEKVQRDSEFQKHRARAPVHARPTSGAPKALLARSKTPVLQALKCVRVVSVVSTLSLFVCSRRKEVLQYRLVCAMWGTQAPGLARVTMLLPAIKLMLVLQRADLARTKTWQARKRALFAASTSLAQVRASQLQHAREAAQRTPTLSTLVSGIFSGFTALFRCHLHLSMPVFGRIFGREWGFLQSV